MVHNDEAGGSGGKQFWELSQEMEEQPHRYEDAAEDTDPDYTTPSGVPFVTVTAESVNLSPTLLPVIVDSGNLTLVHDIPRHRYAVVKQ